MKPEVRPLEPIGDQPVACFAFELKYPHYTELWQFIANPSAYVYPHDSSSTSDEGMQTIMERTIERTTFKIINQPLIIAERYIRSADHLTRITFSAQPNQSHHLSIVTGGRNPNTLIGYKNYPGDVFEVASAAYNPNGALIISTLGQDSYDFDAYAKIDFDREQLTDLIISTPEILAKALEYATKEGAFQPTEVSAITADSTTNRIFRLQELLQQIFPDLSEIEEFIETQVGSKAFKEIKHQLKNQYMYYFKGQQSVCVLYWPDEDGTEPSSMVFFASHQEYVNNEPEQDLTLPLGTTHYEEDFYGDRYYLDTLPNGTINFGVQRQRGTSKSLRFPQKLDADFAALTNPESFAWTHFPWHQSFSLNLA